MEDADEEALRLEELRRIKRATLHELDKQAATYTAANVPPHIQIERRRLRDELGIVETVIKSPLSPAIGDELGEQQRFVYYIEKVGESERKVLEALQRLRDDVKEEFTDIRRGNMRWRTWGTRAFIVIIIIVVAIALALAYVAGRTDGQGWRSVFALWGYP